MVRPGSFLPPPTWAPSTSVRTGCRAPPRTCYRLPTPTRSPRSTARSTTAPREKVRPWLLPSQYFPLPTVTVSLFSDVSSCPQAGQPQPALWWHLRTSKGRGLWDGDEQLLQAGLGDSSHWCLPKSQLCCWAGSELFGGVVAPSTHVESTFSKIAGAGDKDDLSVSIALQTGFISKKR